MTRLFIGLALGVALSACGGTAPFGNGETTTTTEGTETVAGIPAALASDLESFTYNPGAQTLSIRGVNLEDGRFEDVYTRRPALDQGDYEAYSTQAGSLDRHSVAYVRDIRGTRAAMAVTGGQFTFFFAGGAYSNSGNYTAPVEPGSTADGGLVSYAGNYVGVLNGPGSSEDLLPVAPGTPNGIRPSQAAEITGTILINASFSDGIVNGIITDRVFDNTAGITTGSTTADDLGLAPTEIAADGSFFGNSTVDTETRGEYGGIFGGDGATEVAGLVHAQDHISTLTNEEEYGVFVLAQCGTAQADPICDQPNP